MDKGAFDALFRERLLEKLGPLGFLFVGKTLAFRDSDVTVSLVRLAGRLTVPGGISHILCLRHSFLRDLNDESVPRGVTTEVFDYPFKFLPSELSESPETSWRYIPRNLNYPRETYVWRNRDAGEVRVWVDGLAHLIGARFLPWATALGTAGAAAQLRAYGENAWCERLWLKDYEGAAMRSRPTMR